MSPFSRKKVYGGEIAERVLAHIIKTLNSALNRPTKIRRHEFFGQWKERRKKSAKDPQGYDDYRCRHCRSQERPKSITPARY